MSICDEIRIISTPLIAEAKSLRRRNFYDKLDWNDRLIGVLGAKGVGKTTLLLQRLLIHEEQAL